MTGVSTNEEVRVAQRIIEEHINVAQPHTKNYYSNIIEQELKSYSSYSKQWQFAKQLRREIFAFQEQQPNTATNTSITNSYATLFALAQILSSLHPYLYFDKPEPADYINGIEAAQLAQRIDNARQYLKEQGVKELEVYEELADLETYACYGKRKLAQLLLGMTATLIVDQHITPEQGKTISQIVISGINAPEKYLEHIVSFSSKN